MKRQLERSRRIADVLRKMHMLESANLASSMRVEELLSDREKALLDALGDASTGGHAFMNAFGRRLCDVNAQRAQSAQETERIRSECQSILAKQSVVDKRANALLAEFVRLDERKALDTAIDAHLGASAPQGLPSTIAAPDAAGFRGEKE